MVLGGVALLIFRRSPPAVQTAASSPVPAQAPLPPKVLVPHVPLAAPAPSAGSRYTPGAQRSYVMDLHVQAALAGAAPSGGAPAAEAMNLSVQGRWAETFVGGQAGVARYHVTITHAKVLSNGRPADALRAEIEAPFFLERDHDGAVTGFYFERTTP
ncbi:MAG TPA: hypothetical protein VN962_21480, partial [Polyangia bacterium]|nr:hypothetical protein [Polyangia bacterium]